MQPLKTGSASNMEVGGLGQRGCGSSCNFREEGSSSLGRLPPLGPKLLYDYTTVAIITKYSCMGLRVDHTCTRGPLCPWHHVYTGLCNSTRVLSLHLARVH